MKLDYFSKSPCSVLTETGVGFAVVMARVPMVVLDSACGAWKGRLFFLVYGVKIIAIFGSRCAYILNSPCSVLVETGVGLAVVMPGVSIVVLDSAHWTRKRRALVRRLCERSSVCR